MFIEKLCIVLVCVSFIKNIKYWKNNLISTCVFCFAGYTFLYKNLKYKSFDSFYAGNPLCTKQSFADGGFCIHYLGVFTYVIGQILWGYYAVKSTNFTQYIKSIIYYMIHSIPIIGIYLGYFHNWDLNLQLKIDMSLFIMCSLNADFEICSWFGFCDSRRFEQFDRSNYRDIRRNFDKYQGIEKNNDFEDTSESDTDDVDDVDNTNDLDDTNDDTDDTDDTNDLDDTNDTKDDAGVSKRSYFFPYLTYSQ